MITKQELEEARRKAIEYLEKAKIIITEEEKANMEIVDLGLSDLKHFGLEIVVYVNTKMYCAKELVLFPRQICVEHRHPPFDNSPGKQETFRCRWGKVFLYTEPPLDKPIQRRPGPGEPGEKSPSLGCIIPEGKEECFTVRYEIILNPGEQYTIPPDTLHWFQAGDEGAIVSEFSTQSRDEFDIFTDPAVRRLTVVK